VELGKMREERVRREASISRLVVMVREIGGWVLGNGYICLGEVKGLPKRHPLIRFPPVD
jgi:hypothetical protein